MTLVDMVAGEHQMRPRTWDAIHLITACAWADRRRESCPALHLRRRVPGDRRRLPRVRALRGRRGSRSVDSGLERRRFDALRGDRIATFRSPAIGRHSPGAVPAASGKQGQGSPEAARSAPLGLTALVAVLLDDPEAALLGRDDSGARELGLAR